MGDTDKAVSRSSFREEKKVCPMSIRFSVNFQVCNCNIYVLAGSATSCFLKWLLGFSFQGYGLQFQNLFNSN